MKWFRTDQFKPHLLIKNHLIPNMVQSYIGVSKVKKIKESIIIKA